MVEGNKSVSSDTLLSEHAYVSFLTARVTLLLKIRSLSFLNLLRSISLCSVFLSWWLLTDCPNPLDLCPIMPMALFVRYLFFLVLIYNCCRRLVDGEVLHWASHLRLAPLLLWYDQSHWKSTAFLVVMDMSHSLYSCYLLSLVDSARLTG